MSTASFLRALDALPVASDRAMRHCRLLSGSRAERITPSARTGRSTAPNWDPSLWASAFPEGIEASLLRHLADRAIKRAAIDHDLGPLIARPANPCTDLSAALTAAGLVSLSTVTTTAGSATASWSPAGR